MEDEKLIKLLELQNKMIANIGIILTRLTWLMLVLLIVQIISMFV